MAFRRKGIRAKEKKYIYEFILIPNDPFLHENQPLPPGVELQLTFDRLNAEFSTLKINTEDPDSLKGTVLELKDVFAQVEYVSSPILRNFADRINTAPITYIYDECTVLYKTLPVGEQHIRLENIRGGNAPDYIFIGVVETSSFSGSTSCSPLRCQNFGITEVNLTLNGNSCHGYPIKTKNNYPLWSYVKFKDVLGKTFNSTLGNQMTIDEFKNKLVYAHKFEGEESQQGWLGIIISLEKAFDTSKTLGLSIYF